MGPLQTKVDFIRSEVFAEVALDYYPWGRTDADPKGKGFCGRVVEFFTESKPYLELAGGFSHQNAISHIEFTSSLAGVIANERTDDTFNLWYASPRIGFDSPLTENLDVSMTFGYLFFDSHQDEFNGAMVASFVRHTFGK